jgi:hypothetical protein
VAVLAALLQVLQLRQLAVLALLLCGPLARLLQQQVRQH